MVPRSCLFSGLHMNVRVQMIHAIFAVAGAAGAETEFQFGITDIGPAAHRTDMSHAHGTQGLCGLLRFLHFPFELIPS